jgi:ubiquinone/menaquinone biosynthesis C-methylase UbiE
VVLKVDMAEFDLVAPMYDETRLPPTQKQLEAVARALGDARRVLEGGVGTGRYALPLLQRGFRLTGIDLSLPMMHRARAKGLDSLVRGDLYHLPFRDRYFEATLIVHVLQLLPDPFPVLRELARVADCRVVTYLPDHRGVGRAIRREVRTRYIELAREMGYTVEVKTRYWENGNKILERFPPEEIFELEEEHTPDPEAAKRWRDLRYFWGLVTVPPEVHEKIVERLRAEIPRPEKPWEPRVRHSRVAAWDARKLYDAIARSLDQTGASSAGTV